MSTENFITEFKEFIAANELIKPQSKVLAAVSGGIDSVVLAHLLKRCGYSIAIAQCNFKLRESAGEDEKFVHNLASLLEARFHSTSFETEKYAQQHGISIQMAARQLRYEWLEQVRSENSYQVIATGHQLNDQAETVLLNLAKGTGISGLRGIVPRRGLLIRPLLFAEKDAIRNFASQQNIAFREDESNKSAKYERNLVRLEMVPLIEQINPSFVRGIRRTMDNLSYNEHLYKERLAYYQKRLLDHRKDAIYIPLRRLKAYPFPAHLLYDILQPYGFNFDQVKTAVEFDMEESGRLLESGKWRLLKDRRFLILSPAGSRQSARIYIEKVNRKVPFPDGTLKVEFGSRPAKVSIPKNANTAWVDAEKLEFPLVLRPWKSGDYFYPLGMTKPHSGKIGKKNLSDLFSDLKLSALQKEHCWLLQSGKKIVWVAGLRLDDRFKVTSSTRQIAKFTLLDQ